MYIHTYTFTTPERKYTKMRNLIINELKFTTRIGFANH